MKTTVHEALKFEVLATGLGFPEGPVILDDGSFLAVDIEGGRVLRVEDGEVSVVATPGGGPNGLALADPQTAVVANNGGFLWTTVNGVRIPIDHPTHTNEPPGFTGGWMESVDLQTGEITRLCDSFEGKPLRGPNDLVFDAVGGLWFTDHGKGRFESVDRGALYYAPPGNGPLKQVAFPLLGPNGVGLSPDGSTVYVAETHTGRLWAWDLSAPGEVSPAAGSLAVRHGGRCVVATPFSFDSLAVEEDGRIAIGALGEGIIVVTPDGMEVDIHPIPGDVTTNIAFGGADMKTAVITLFALWSIGAVCLGPFRPQVGNGMTAPTEEERAAFRAEVDAWFAANAPRKGSAEDFSAIHIVSGNSISEYREAERRALEVSLAWQKQLHAAGLSGRSWPADYGGQAEPPWQEEEIAQVKAGYGVSTKVLAVGLEMLPPVLFVHGSHQQRLRYLPPAVRGEETWCQLLSEPDAGSDLGSAKSFAAPVSGGWSVSGQKVWTSGAGTSNFALLIARTDREVSGMGGLTCFLMDMSQPGVEVRPLRQMSGAYHFNEVFLEEAFVPEESLVGQLGDARSILRTMLASERAAIGGGTSARGAQQLLQLARHLGRNQEALVRQEISAAYVRERVLDLTQQRIAAGAVVPASGSVVKLLYSEHARLCANAGTWLLGPAATVEVSPDAQTWKERLLFAPGLRIGGGTDEIQRNTIAERGLSLPR